MNMKLKMPKSAELLREVHKDFFANLNKYIDNYKQNMERNQHEQENLVPKEDLNRTVKR